MNQKLIPSFFELTGRSENHLVLYKDKVFLHPEVNVAFLKLKEAALLDGIELEIISGFRNYDRQLTIWNNKVKKSTLSPLDTIHSIMRWSALPGTSRHHWGTDIDVFDPSRISKDEVKLELFEYENGGVFSDLNNWLTQKINDNDAFGFYRPYNEDRGGVSPEPWHLSYKPISKNYYSNFTFDIYQKNILGSEMLLKDDVLKNASELYKKYFYLG